MIVGSVLLKKQKLLQINKSKKLTTKSKFNVPNIQPNKKTIFINCNNKPVEIQKRFYARDPSTGYPSPSPNIEREFKHIEDSGSFHKPQRRFNTFINIVPQQEAWVVERFGSFNSILTGGLHFLIPIVDRIAYTFSLKEEALIIPSRAAITKDNVRISVVGVLFFRVIDPQKAAYGVGDPLFALSQLAQTTLRSILGELSLDRTFHERDEVNKRVVNVCNAASSEWGINCLRHEIREIVPPENVLHSMEMQVEAERRKRVEILQSEGHKQAEINNAEGAKQSLILQSEANKLEQINKAQGYAEAIRLQAEAEAQGILYRAKGAAEAIERIAGAITKPGAQEAMNFQVALKYVEAFEKLAKESTSVIIPSNAADISSMIAQATTVLNKMSPNKPQKSEFEEKK